MSISGVTKGLNLAGKFI